MQRSFLIFVAALACVGAHANDVTAPGASDDAWSLPAWVGNDEPVKGSVDDKGITSGVQIKFQLNDEDAQVVHASKVEFADGRVSFTLPKLSYEAYGLLRIWAEDAASGERIGDAHTVGIADWREFDISGQTNIELLFPIKAWKMQIRFTPCCLINAGYLLVQRVPINPVGKSNGLPGALASAFLHLAPDDTVIATSGLNADIAIDPESPYAASPEDVTVYRWLKGQWTPVIGAELERGTTTIRFKALEGGYFVLAPKLGAQS